MYKFLPIAGLLLGLAGSLRGQLTEWPVTVEPGHFLLEVDALTLTLDREPGQKYTAFGAGSVFLTTGLTDRWDLQVGAELFLSQKYENGGLTDRDSGVGDIYVRTKWRFYEAADTYTSVALLPYVKIPTNSGGVGNDSLEGGLIVPFVTQLTGDFELIAMAKVDFLRNDNDDGYDSYWFGSMAVSHSVTKLAGAYAELAVAKSSGGAPWEGTFGAGVTVTVGKLAWWDFAVYHGLSDGAADWSTVVRFNWGI